MKISVTQTVEVDPAKWALEYGVEKSEVRKDVKEYFANYCQDQVNLLELNETEK